MDTCATPEVCFNERHPGPKLHRQAVRVNTAPAAVTCQTLSTKLLNIGFNDRVGIKNVGTRRVQDCTV